jgi:hypothetical protein
MTTHDTLWVADLRSRWLARPAAARKGLESAKHLSATAHAELVRAMTWRHAWSMARLHSAQPSFLAYCRARMRVSGLECVALSRHWVMESERLRKTA